ncbi:hypothetical protein RN001_015886 [Aquatica leii]|uniref:Metaxin-1 n=1 Tax=Aquatica leii TaxID=1421715 RepID=A0AAN7PNJ7_9COLE|nr:hypothetical protein RN001_015886 [Aquatica leii]
MPVLSPFNLRIWEPDFGLPTVEPDCLIALTALKMCNAPVKISYGSCPQLWPIPNLVQNDVCLTKSPEFVDELMKICNIDSKLDSRNQGHCMAYKRYFLESFEPLFFYDCWIHKVNYQHTIRRWFMSAITFPFNHFYMKSRYKEANERYECIKKNNSNEVIVSELYESATRCLEDFNSMLSDNRTYLLGNTPSSLDAIVYSYLAIALNLPIPDTTFQNLVKNYKYLYKYVRSITRTYYPELEVKYKYVQPENALSDRASNLTLIVAALLDN